MSSNNRVVPFTSPVDATITNEAEVKNNNNENGLKLRKTNPLSFDPNSQMVLVVVVAARRTSQI